MKFLSDIEVEEGLRDKDGGLGADGQVLSSTGSLTSWIDAASGSIGGSITDNQIAVGASTANNIEGSDNFRLIPLTLGTTQGGRLVVQGRLQISDEIGLGAANLFIGDGAGSTASSGGNLGIGGSALGSSAGGELNCAVGYQALNNSTLGDRNTVLGQSSLFFLVGTGQDDNIAIGAGAAIYYSTGTGQLTQSSQGVYIGSDTRASANNISNEIAIGYGVVGGGSDTITLGNSSVDLLRIPGLNATSGQVLAYNNTTGGFEAATPSSGSIGGSIAATQIAVGATTANNIEGASDFTYIDGRISLGDSNAGSSLYIGVFAGANATTGSSNVAVGKSSMGSVTTAYSNSAFGTASLSSAVSSSVNQNTAIGQNSLGNIVEGLSNVALGDQAAYFRGPTNLIHTISNTSVYVGADTRPAANDETNQIVIGYEAVGGGSNTVTLGNDDIDTFRIPGLGNTNGYVLTYSTADDGFILAAGGGGGGIGGATVTNQVAFGSATASEITSDSTFTFAKNGQTGSLATTLFEVGDGDSSDNTSYGSVFITAKQVNDSSSRARFQLYSGANLRGYLQCSGTSSAVTLLGVENLVLSAGAKVQIDGGSTSTILIASASGSNVGIGNTSPAEKLDVTGRIKASAGIQVGNETGISPVAGLIGTLRYRTYSDASFDYSAVDVCMQDGPGAGDYEWINIVTKRW